LEAGIYAEVGVTNVLDQTAGFMRLQAVRTVARITGSAVMPEVFISSNRWRASSYLPV